MTHEKEQKLVAMFKAGEKVTYIAAILGISRSTVTAVARRHNLPYRIAVRKKT